MHPSSDGDIQKDVIQSASLPLPKSGVALPDRLLAVIIKSPKLPLLQSSIPDYVRLVLFKVPEIPQRQ